jgi:hypothetical protein
MILFKPGERMNQKFLFARRNERGGARLKFVIVIAVFALVLYTGYVYVPIAYEAYQFKDVMQNKCDLAATQGYEPQWVKEQLMKSAPDYHVPPDAVITPAQRDQRVEVRVQFTRPISFPGFTYNYDFDYTARSTAFLMIK